MSKKGQITKDKILKEAVNLFNEHGYTKASTRLLVGRLGMSSSAIYAHFSSKDEILYTIIKNAGDKVLTTLNRIIKNNQDPVDCLKEMISSMVYLYSSGKNRKEFALFIDELNQLPAHYRELCNIQHGKILDLFRDKTSEFESTNHIDHTVASFGVLGSVLWVYRWYKDDGKLSLNQISDDLIKLLFNGLQIKDHQQMKLLQAHDKKSKHSVDDQATIR